MICLPELGRRGTPVLYQYLNQRLLSHRVSISTESFIIIHAKLHPLCRSMGEEGHQSFTSISTKGFSVTVGISTESFMNIHVKLHPLCWSMGEEGHQSFTSISTKGFSVTEKVSAVSPSSIFMLSSTHYAGAWEKRDTSPLPVSQPKASQSQS